MKCFADPHSYILLSCQVFTQPWLHYWYLLSLTQLCGLSHSFSHTIGDLHTQITASYSPSTAIFFSQFVFASLTWTVFIHTMIHSCILCLRHPLASQPFAVNWLLTHALMTLVDMTALHKQFRTQFISQHWTNCLCTVKFLTHTVPDKLYHTFMPTGSHTLSISLSCSPMACQTVTGLRSPLPSHKHYFTHTTSLLYSTLITHSFLQQLPDAEPRFLVKTSTLSHMILHTYAHTTIVFRFLFHTWLLICSLYDCFWFTPSCW